MRATSSLTRYLGTYTESWQYLRKTKTDLSQNAEERKPKQYCTGCNGDNLRFRFELENLSVQSPALVLRDRGGKSTKSFAG